MKVNYTSKVATRIISSGTAKEFKVGDILTIADIGNHWAGYEAPYGDGFIDFSEGTYNYFFEVENVNVRAIDYRVEFKDNYDEYEVNMPEHYKFEVIETDLQGWEDDHESYSEAYKAICDIGFETIKLKILNNQEKEEEFDLDSMISDIEERLENE